MAKRKVRFACFQSAITAPGVFGGESALSPEKFRGIEMFLEGGMLTVFYKGSEVVIPTMNVKSMIMEKELAQHKLSA